MNPYENDLLDLRRELQTVRLEVVEKDQEIERLKAELERCQAGQADAGEESLTRRLETLFTEISLPLVQIWTQAYLYEARSKVIPAQDILSSAKRLAAMIKAGGLEPVGEFDLVETFDTSRHIPLGSQQIQPGDAVRVRLVGTQYRGKILRKANVEKAEV